MASSHDSQGDDGPHVANAIVVRDQRSGTDDQAYLVVSSDKKIDSPSI